MLITFEGQDGAGKTSVLEAVFHQLDNQKLPALAVPEFSTSPYGQRLLDALAEDKFLRPVGSEATRLTRALDVVADLYYLDEHVIGPALASGLLVLKDRHIDTVFSTLVPALARRDTIETEARALTWLNAVLGELRYQPDLTVYVDAPLEVRLRRIKGRTRHLIEDRAHEVSREDIAVFAERDRLMRTVIDAEPSRFLVVDNGARPVEQATKDVLSWITAHKVRNS